MGWASHLAVTTYDSSLSPAVKYAFLGFPPYYPFLLMTILSPRTLARQGLILYYAQLTLNVAWTPLFFGAKRMGLALVDIITLTGTTFYMTVRPPSLLHSSSLICITLQRVLNEATNGKTALFLLPYCAWLTFATYLNASFLYLNNANTRPENR